MADQNKSDSGKPRNPTGSQKGPSPKRKIVIKKKTRPQNKDISDLYNKGPKPQQGGGQKPAARSQPQGGPGQQQRPVQRDNRNAGQSRPQDQGRRPDFRGRPDQGGRPGGRPGGPGAGGPGGQGGYQRRPGVQSTTPFDALLETTKNSGGGGPQNRGSKPVKKGGAQDQRTPYRGGRKDDSENKFFRTEKRKKTAPITGTTVPKSIEILESIQVGELAKKLNLKPGDVIARLMKMGEMVTINKTIDADTASLLAQEYDCEVKVVSLFDETVIEDESDNKDDHITRPPVVTIMGHVDHGKTKLLDTIRKTNVIDTEAGAITQHIGAYQVSTKQGKITFLDTPGHEAFTAMRARGAAVTDIVILVVAADDGVKDQTVEAITHAKEASIPIIVAVNKVDLETANVDKVKQELASHGLQPEDWGGDTIFCEISAKQNIGIEHLLEMILLSAEVLDLKENPKIRAVGRVVEAKIDPGKGPVATVLIQKGTLREGDPYVVGVFSGRVRTMLDDLGHRLKIAGPATPVEITGIAGVPHAGDPFQAVESDKFGREIADKRQHYKQITDAASRSHPHLGDLKNWLSDHKELKVIIKADVQGSVEAIRDGVLKLSTDDVKIRVIQGATGAISESDVNLASASDALIVGFQVRATPRAADLADENHVEIKYYSIIYDVINELHAAMEGMLEPDKVEEVIGQAEIRQVFRISRSGNIAGCMVIKGKVRRNAQVRVIRNNVVVYTGKIKGLRRHQDEASEVAEGFECGISVDGFNDIQENDILEVFEVKEVARKL